MPSRRTLIESAGQAARGARARAGARQACETVPPPSACRAQVVAPPPISPHPCVVVDPRNATVESAWLSRGGRSRRVEWASRESRAESGGGRRRGLRRSHSGRSAGYVYMSDRARAWAGVASARRSHGVGAASFVRWSVPRGDPVSSLRSAASCW